MRSLIYGIKNIIAWLPIIWQDRDWDYVDLLRLMQFKLKRMLPVIENGSHLYRDRDARQMKIAIELLGRQIDTTWYYDNSRLFREKTTKSLVKEQVVHENQDWLFLLDWLKKYMRGWWD